MSTKPESKSWREMAESHRNRIKTSQIIRRFSEHFDGEIELSASQIKAGEILLRKALPDVTIQDIVSNGKTIVPSIKVNLGD